MVRPPLGSTLFPYTTLFRSCDMVFLHVIEERREADVPGAGVRDDSPVGQMADRRRGVAGGQRADRRAPLGDGRPDRKSTRLNSSHTVIPHAVFCLRKTAEIV